MARTLRRYVLIKGIPKFLKSREGTKAIARTYTNSLETVRTMTSVQIRTKNNWKYGAGINPFNQVASINASNEVWIFESSYNLDTRQGGVLGRWKSGDWAADTVYNFTAREVVPGMSHAFNPNVNGGLSLKIPLAAADVMAASIATVSVAYVF
jgi:hypothetical protein